jgi:hypothetical protein
MNTVLFEEYHRLGYDADVSEEHIAFIFRVEEISSAKTSKQAGGKRLPLKRRLKPASKLLATCFLVFAELISSTLKMEAVCSSETLVETQRTTSRHIPDDNTLHNHCCENLKSYTVLLFFV